MKIRLGKGLLGILFGILLVGCGYELSLSSPQPRPAWAEPEADVFRPYLASLGGAEVLGYAISPPLEVENGRIEQYFVAGKLIYDPDVTAGDHVRLAPLGLQLNLAPVTSNGGYRHNIYPAFLPMYNRLGGKRVVGSPISDVYYNPEFFRYEQYFENLGLYIKEGDPAREVKLLHYGLYFCGTMCQHSGTGEGKVYGPAGSATEPFSTAINRLGSNFLGKPLFGPFQRPDGKTVAVFENILLYTTEELAPRVFALSITEQLGVQRESPSRDYGDPRMVFYIVDGNRGFNIPLIFSDYLAQHGGIEIFGVPITEVHEINEERYRQCYENGCLEYHTNAIDDFKVRPAPIGVEYFHRFFPGIARDLYEAKSLDFVGKPLFGPLRRPDGKTIFIFENVVIYTTDDAPADLHALPIVEQLGIHREPPTHNYNDPNMLFVAIEGDRGFNIPRVFIDYMAQHRRPDLLGDPITQVHEIGAGQYRQCFENGCLEYHLYEKDGNPIRLTPLGVAYFRRFFPKSAEQHPIMEGEPIKRVDTSEIKLAVWAAMPIISPNEPQHISLVAFDGGYPAANREFVLTLTYPDGHKENWKFPATGPNGQATKQIPAIQAPNGSLIQYRVCMRELTYQSACAEDNYIIWEP